MRIIVSNTGPLLHLSEAESLDLMRLAGQIFVPPSVATEAKRYMPTWHSDQPAWIVIAELVEPNLSEAETWRQSGILDPGEAEALALARQLKADWFLALIASSLWISASVIAEARTALNRLFGP